MVDPEVVAPVSVPRGVPPFRRTDPVPGVSGTESGTTGSVVDDPLAFRFPANRVYRASPLAVLDSEA